MSAVGGSTTNTAPSVPYTLNSKHLTTAIQSGKTYRVRYRCYNAHGWGSYSPIGSIIAATKPDPPLAPTISIDGTNVKIVWAEPTNTGGNLIAITKYKVEIQKHDGTYAEDLTNCDAHTGSGYAALVSSKTCYIPMSLITDTSTGFGFTAGQDVTARVTAGNVIDYGLPGPVSTVPVLAQVLPLKPASPPTRDSATNENQIVIDWALISSPGGGGSAITSYNL